MKKFIFIVLVFVFLPVNVYATEGSLSDSIKKETEKFDFSPLEELRDKYKDEDILGDKSFKEVVLELASGNSSVDSETITNYIFAKIHDGLKKGMVSLSYILFVVIMCGMIKNIGANQLDDMGNICEYVGFLIVVITLIGTFNEFIQLTGELTSLMQSFVRVIFPPLLTLMTAVGGVSSVGVFQPAMVVLSGSMIEFMGNMIMPIGIFGGMTGILSGVSDRIKLEKLSGFCGSAAKWLMGIASTIYVGILSLQGMMAATYDGISIRTAKYTVDSFIPMIGGMMSDTVDTVLGCSLLLKNAIGFTGLLLIGSMCILPLVRYITCIMSYKLLGALIQTTSDSKTVKAIDGLVSGITTMFIIVCVTVVMTFITITLAINAGNTNLMLR